MRPYGCFIFFAFQQVDVSTEGQEEEMEDEDESEEETSAPKSSRKDLSRKKEGRKKGTVGVTYFKSIINI